jgi:hypothetical protein
MSIIAETTNGQLRRYLQGEYPWSSSVVLEGELNGVPFRHVFPTEINPRGPLQVDLKQAELLKKLGAS